jgi:hypothetical protein
MACRPDTVSAALGFHRPLIAMYQLTYTYIWLWLRSCLAGEDGIPLLGGVVLSRAKRCGENVYQQLAILVDTTSL